MRGEYQYILTRKLKKWELPPRARRIQVQPMNHWVMIGTTSACAENTQTQLGIALLLRNYLRVRGEYGRRMLVPIQSLELPPRARRIRFSTTPRSLTGGTTSACAENTRRLYRGHRPMRNYLRVRGEYRLFSLGSFHRGELPPRARRIQTGGVFICALNGTTSACAENTQ